jgi:hypothetical protein
MSDLTVGEWIPMQAIKLEVSEKDLEIIVRALAGQPYGLVAPLMAKLHEQHTSQKQDKEGSQ